MDNWHHNRAKNTAKMKTSMRRAKPDRASSGSAFLSLLSTHFLICNEKIEGKGEDCGFEAYTCNGGVLGAFDGCGGLGAKICASVSGKTEAYLASRAIGSAVKQWFYTNADQDSSWSVEALREQVLSKLELCQAQTEDLGFVLRGSLIRPFPSTMAMTVFQLVNGKLLSKHIWAGDSRTYVLDCDGLGQISYDDIKGEDAMSNLTRDGALTNLVSADKRFTLHSATFTPQLPCILFCATDGCFGYVSSPMEFEHMILSSLINASSVKNWQYILSQEISERSGDDQTIAIAAFGFENFAQLKQYYWSRYQIISQIVAQFDASSPEIRQALWEAYKPQYYRYAAQKE